MPDLRPGQYKRVGRIAEKNPERAEKVADRMKTRASREERGKNIANKDEILRRADENLRTKGPREAGGGLRRAQATRRDDEVRNRPPNRDVPLAPTPEPLFSRRAEEGKSSAMEYMKSRGR